MAILADMGYKRVGPCRVADLTPQETRAVIEEWRVLQELNDPRRRAARLGIDPDEPPGGPGALGRHRPRYGDPNRALTPRERAAVRARAQARHLAD